MKTLRHKFTSCLAGALLALHLTGCQDDPLFSAPGYDGNGTATRAEMTQPGPLQKVGDYWATSDQRVPLVGAGRVISNLSQGLVSIGTNAEFDNVVDLDLNNYTGIPSTVQVEALGNQIISVKDLYRTYAPGETVGFVIENGNTGSLLDAKLLNLLAISIYRKGEFIKSYNASESGSLLNVGVLASSTSALQTVSIKVDEPFDEVMLATTGITANAISWSGMKIYYAFVGETPKEEVTTQTYPSAKFENTSNIGSSTGIFGAPTVDDLLDPDYTDGVSFTSPLELPFVEHKTTLDYGKDIQAGTEIGYIYTEGSIANLSVLPTLTLTPYDADGNAIETDQYKQTGLLGLGLIGGGQGTYSVLLSKDARKLKFSYEVPLGLSLGTSKLMRAYTRKATLVDPTSYFTAPETVTTSASSYYFMEPLKNLSGQGGTLTAMLKDNPGGTASISNSVVTLPDGSKPYVLQGMQEGFTYEVEFTYTAPDGRQFQTTSAVTRTADTGKDCQTHYMTGEDFHVVAANEIAGINIISKMSNANNITNSNTQDFAQVTNVASIAGVGTYAAVKSEKKLQPTNGKWRVGFTINSNVGLLGLQALKFFTIALYNEGTQVDYGVSANNNLVSLDLIHINNQATVRVSLETDKEFDCVALQTAGVADVQLSKLEIYNAFYEDASCEGNGVMEECSQLFTYTTNNLQVDMRNTGFNGIQAGAGMYNLANLLDGDNSTAARVTTGVDVGNFQLGLTFQEQKAGSWIGLLMKTPAGLLDASLLSNISLEIRNNGTTVETIKQESGLLGLDLIGYNETSYIEAYPKHDYDGIIVKFSGIKVMSSWLFYGLYGTKDLDADGIKDCEEEEPEIPRQSVTIENLTLCDETGTGVSFTPIVTLNNGIDPAGNYWLECLGTDAASHVIPVKIQAGNSSYRLVAANADTPLKLEKGYYTMRLYNCSEADWTTENKSQYEVSTGSALLIIHPRQTTWTGSNSTDWNDWSNWSDGSPWGCTDVIIPGGLQSYPILTQADYEAGMNNCARIHIEDGGQIVNTRYLNTYDGAWVDIQLEGGRYYMLASPLKDMVSGDWFISPNVTLATSTGTQGLPLFTTFNEITYPEQRTNPIVYQRLWSTQAPVKNPDGYEAKDKVAPDETQWTPPYNAVNQPYGLGMGFSLMANKAEGNTYLFRFPKQHVTYHYYNLAGQPTGMTESISRPSRTGRFIDEAKWDNDKLTVTQRNTEASTAFLVGNPFVSYLNLSAFMSANGISEVKLFDGTTNTNNSLILIDGELVSNAGGYVRRNVMPMEAFFVMTPDGQAKREMTVTFNANMQTTDAGTTSAVTRSLPSDSFLRLSATLDGKTTHALLRVSPTASAGVIPGEDTKLLVESEARPAVAIYTVADGQALDIQQVPDDVRRISLGFYLPDGGSADIRLKADFTDPQWHDWFLLDLRNGQRRRLNTATLTLEDVRNGSGQYALTRED